jgi:uncharacterized membrane protein (UPF0182 family)
MMYNDKVGYGPTVSTALDGIFAGRRRDRHRSGTGQRGPPAGRPADQPTGGQPPANAPEVPTPIAAVPPPGGVTAVTGEIRCAAGTSDRPRRGEGCSAQRNFAQYGAALQRLDDAMNKYEAAK